LIFTGQSFIFSESEGILVATDISDPHAAKLKPRLAEAARLIESKVSDAAAHAERSLTRSVVNADDGRQTWRTIATQKSAKAAQTRLSELLEALAGPSKTSLSGHVQDSRAMFYYEAHEHWSALIPDPIRNPAGPTQTGENRARGIILFGLSPRQEIDPVFLTAKSSLQAAINAAASASISDKQRQAILDGWEQRTVEQISRKVAMMLSDSQVAVVNQVGRDLVKQEFKS
jgi:hypothetical protein